MSGIYLLVLIAVWLLVGWFIYRIWHRWQPADLIQNILRFGVVALLFVVWFGGAFWMVIGKKEYYDAQVRELCAKDGGVKIYESVTLPADKFNKWGQINFADPTQGENSLGADYLVEENSRSLRAENEQPTLIRRHYRVFRRSDRKLLGERISYSRRGGDLPGPWNPSSFSCPDYREKGLWDSLFIKSNPNGGG